MQPCFSARAAPPGVGPVSPTPAGPGTLRPSRGTAAIECAHGTPRPPVAIVAGSAPVIPCPAMRRSDLTAGGRIQNWSSLLRTKDQGLITGNRIGQDAVVEIPHAV